MRYDSIIFDMDGTLWDAVDSYAAIWNKTLHDCAVEREPVTRRELIALMGKPLKVIASILVPGLDGPALDAFFAQLEANDLEMMPRLGGRLYPGVEDTLRELSGSGIPLYLVSNCGPEGLPMFMDYTGLRPYFRDWLSYGSTGCDKDVNIRTLVERYNLEKPLYVGDTVGDLRSTRRAGASFAWASYGFGLDFNPSEADIVLAAFTDLPAAVRD
ncbi:MAG: HAD family hydrolase [Muribaculaceae bacterium]|nr:HAD family hydrolase [Muribaculaceae bacterium]